jgi:hypothetical protein
VDVGDKQATETKNLRREAVVRRLWRTPASGHSYVRRFKLQARKFLACS